MLKQKFLSILEFQRIIKKMVAKKFIFEFNNNKHKWSHKERERSKHACR